MPMWITFILLVLALPVIIIVSSFLIRIGLNMISPNRELKSKNKKKKENENEQNEMD